jgi:anti-sigma factor RsiW
MNCLECQDWLQRRLDGLGAGDDKVVEQHLSGCGACRAQHAAATRLLQGLRRLPSVSAPPDLHQRVVAAVLKDRVLRRRRMTQRLYVTAALAASVFLMLLISYSMQQRPAPGPAPVEPPPLVQSQPAPEVSPDERRPGAALPEAMVQSLGALLPDMPKDLPAVAELEPLDPAAESLKQAGREVTASLQTMTRSARQAFDYFSRELPAVELTTRE